MSFRKAGPFIRSHHLRALYVSAVKFFPPPASLEPQRKGKKTRGAPFLGGDRSQATSPVSPICNFGPSNGFQPWRGNRNTDSLRKSQGLPGECLCSQLCTRAYHGLARPEAFFQSKPLIVSKLLFESPSDIGKMDQLKPLTSQNRRTP